MVIYLQRLNKFPIKDLLVVGMTPAFPLASIILYLQIFTVYVACTKNYWVRTRPSNSTYNLDFHITILSCIPKYLAYKLRLSAQSNYQCRYNYVQIDNTTPFLVAHCCPLKSIYDYFHLFKARLNLVLILMILSFRCDFLQPLICLIYPLCSALLVHILTRTFHKGKRHVKKRPILSGQYLDTLYNSNVKCSESTPCAVLGRSRYLLLVNSKCTYASQ